MSTDELNALVRALPELYQPVFGHPEFASAASRPCADRLAAIVTVVDALRGELRRPLRIIDLGCAQGYFALELAARGAVVTGVDRLPQNIALCVALAAAHPELAVRFVEGDAASVCAGLAPGEFDVVLALSVVHHLAHERGVDATTSLLQETGACVEAVLAETALRPEALYWASALPMDPRELFAGFAFAHPFARFDTHLSEIARPLFFASNAWCWLGATLSRIESWTLEPHELAGGIHQGSRRYYFLDGRMAKYFRFDGAPGARNRTELAREAAFLRAPPPLLPRVPRLSGYGADDGFGWLVRDLVPGRRLSALVAADEPVDRERVVRDVLDELCILEAAELYHGDVRIWNVIVEPDGRSTLIDYGDITTEPADCAWPGNVFLAFIVFVHELLGTGLPRIVPARVPAFTPQQFDPPWREWVLRLWQQPMEGWTFARMREALAPTRAVRHDGVAGAAGAGSVPLPPQTVWQTAIEQYLELIGRHVQRSADATARGVADRLHLVETVARLTQDAARADRGYAEAQRRLDDEHRARTNAEAAGAAALEESARARGDLAVRDRALQDARAAHVALVEAAAVWEREALGKAQAVAEAREAQRCVADAITRQERALADLEQEQAAVEALRAQATTLDAERRAAAASAEHWWRESMQWHEQWVGIQRTRSWRVTAPLRAAKSLARRGADTARRARGWLIGTAQAALHPALRRVAGALRDRPGLHYRIGTAIRRHPQLHRRVRALVHEAQGRSLAALPADPAAVGAALAAAAEHGARSHLTAHARRVLRDLRDATAPDDPGSA